MLQLLLGTVSNLIGFTACVVLTYFSFRIGRLGEKRAFLYSVGAFLLSIAFLIYGITFSMGLTALIVYKVRISLHQFFVYWKIVSLLILLGYFLLGLSYFFHTLQRLLLGALILPLVFSMIMIETMNTILAFGLFIVVMYNLAKSKQQKGYFTFFAYCLLLVSQLMIVWGIQHSLQVYYWGIVMRGGGFAPLLLVALKSESG